MTPFKYFESPIAQPLPLTLPDTGHRDTTKTVRGALRDIGLTVPRDLAVFWVNSRRCLLSHRGAPLGELIEVVS